MKPIYQHLQKKVLFVGLLSLVLASCGSYEYASYEDDGIYSSNAQEVYVNNGNREDYDDPQTTYDDSDYYEQLFAEQSTQIENLPNGGLIFTDIDSYSSAAAADQANYNNQEGLNYTGGYAGWGDQTSGVSINIYQDPFPYYYSPYMTPYYGYGYGGYGGFYDPYWNFGYGYNNWGWNFGYGYHNPWRWNHWGWRAGWAYNPYSPYYYGGGYYNYLHNNYYYNDRNVAYNSGRRSSTVDYNENYNRSNYHSRISRSRLSKDSDSRRVRAVRSNRSYSSDDNNRTYSTRTTRVESPTTTRRSNRTYRSSERSSTPTRVRTTRRSRSNDTPTYRRSTPSRSSAVRSAPTRTTRSSGTRTSRSSRGRGN